ncbi:MAG: ChrR family anti-sigma-E factor [Parvibaculaceae bacterium]
MTIRHHISDDLLIAYAAGSLPEAWSLLVATHLALCPDCRHAAEEAEAVGATLLDDLAPADLSDDAFDRLMARLDAGEGEAEAAPARTAAPVPSVLPEPLKSYVGGDLHALRWRRLGKGAFHIPIPTRDGEAQARLLKVPAGSPVPMHGHNGEELTLVLAGAFTTHQGAFHRGDVEAADDEIEHMPVAAPGEDCICLAVTDAPLRFKSLAARLVQPFIGI